MSLLKEIAVKAKWDGSFTENWSTLRQLLSLECCLEHLPGDSDLQKLQAWARTEGLLMDFELHFADFSSHVRSVTFWKDPQAGADLQP